MGDKYFSEIVNINEEVKNYRNAICFVCGTGSGKSHWVKNVLTNKGKVLFITSRRAKVDEDLVDESFTDDIISSICKGRYERILITNHQLCCLIKKVFDPTKYSDCISTFDLIINEFDYIVVDEVHSIISDSTFTDDSFILKKFIEYTAFKMKKITILLSATIEYVGCCHPFPISSNEKQLKKSKTISDYAVIHNGIIFLTADKKSPLSDTMLFIRDYLTKISSNRNWFYNKKNTELIYELINSKMAILNGNGDITATEGFHKGADGNYYSNCSYMNTCLSLYDEWFYDDTFSELPLMRLKRNEVVCFNDGRTEEYENGFHDLYPIYLTKEGDVYADYIGCSAGEKIPMEQLELLGEGSVFKINSPMEQTVFRKDAVGLI